MMNLKRSLNFLFFAVCLSSVGTVLADTADLYKFSELPVKGVVTMIDLGAEKCVPCKMMAPIMAKLEKAYAGRAAIVFIDVWKNEEQAGRFGIRAIPTQVFFNEKGKEVYRHVGFMSEEDIAAQLEKMGVR
jgi:thioredoxin 1